MKSRNITLLVALLALLVAACSSGNDYSPKPQAYLRIDMPQHAYLKCDTSALPFTFEHSTLSRIDVKKSDDGLKYVDISYPDYCGAVVFLTYKHLASPSMLQGQVDTSYRLLSKHFDYSTGVRDQYVDFPTSHVYSTTYHITGQRAASPCQFYATDSVEHFLRGALFFDVRPNNDSLAPVIQFIEADIDHLLESLEWR